MKTTMVYLFSGLGSLAILGFLLTGCSTVQDTIYMQGLNVSGPLNLPPIHANNDSVGSKVSISPHFAVKNGTTVDGTVDANQYSLPGNNLHWNFPTSSFGVDLDARVSSAVAVSFGLNYASAGQDGLLGGSGGLGFMFHGDNAMGRFELGLQFQTMRYDASSVLEQTITPWYSSNSTTTVAYFHDIGTSTPLGYYGSLLIQSKKLNSLFDIFGQLAVSHQGLSNFTPSTEVAYLGVMTYIRTDTRTGNSATLFTLTPGVSFNLGAGTHLLGAVRIIKEIDFDADKFLFQPLVQFDIGL